CTTEDAALFAAAQVRQQSSVLCGQQDSSCERGNYRGALFAVSGGNGPRFDDCAPFMGVTAQYSQLVPLAERMEPVVAGSKMHFGCKVPELLDLMRLPAFEEVAHQPILSVKMKNHPPVQHRVRQPQIAGVMSRKQSESSATDPLFYARLREALPRERAVRDSLIEFVHADRIVRGGAAKLVALVSLGDVNVSPRIHQPAAAIDREPHAQGISVPVAAAPDAVGTCVDEHLRSPVPGAGDDVESSVFKCDR